MDKEVWRWKIDLQALVRVLLIISIVVIITLLVIFLFEYSNRDIQITIDGNYQISPIVGCPDNLSIYFGIKYQKPLVKANVGERWNKIPDVEEKDAYIKVVCNPNPDLFYFGWDYPILHFPIPTEGQIITIEK